MNLQFQIQLHQDRVIRCNYYQSKQPSKGTLLLVHGYKGHKDWGMFPYAAEKLSDWLDVVTFNFSMNGVGEDCETYSEPEKFAHNTYSRELEDLHTLIDAVTQGKFEDMGIKAKHPIFLIGHSRGGAESLIYAFDNPNSIRGVIGWNCISVVDSFFTEDQKNEMKEKGRSSVLIEWANKQMPLDVEFLEDMASNEKRYNILERLKTAQIPIALIQCTQDFDRLIKGSKTMKQLNPNIQLKLVQGGNHFFGVTHPLREPTMQLDEAIHISKDIIKSLI